MSSNKILDWFLRFIKGMFIGSGAILPGVSGGALAAVFGIYERIIKFLSNPFKDFLKNVFFFIPVGMGALFGVFVLAYPIDYFLEHNAVQVLWCFIGCIIGTFPALFKEAGKNGRKPVHLIITAITAIIVLTGLIFIQNNLNVYVAQTFTNWILAGAIFALGFIVPGLSPSNFLMYMNLYEPMTKGIKDLDFSILMPVALGGILCILLLTKLVGFIMSKAYASIFHFILGVVIASTVIIMPAKDAYIGISLVEILITIVLFILGIAIGFGMGILDSKYKIEN